MAAAATASGAANVGRDIALLWAVLRVVPRRSAATTAGGASGWGRTPLFPPKRADCWGCELPDASVVHP